VGEAEKAAAAGDRSGALQYLEARGIGLLMSQPLSSLSCFEDAEHSLGMASPTQEGGKGPGPWPLRLPRF